MQGVLSLDSSELIFPIQRIAEDKELQVYRSIKEMDFRLETLGDRVAARSVMPHGTQCFTKFTLLFGRWVCNFKCPEYCYTKDLQAGVTTLSQTKALIEEARSHGAAFTYWPGTGEVTLLRDFWELMAFQASVGMPAVVFTNGSIFVDDRLCHRVLGISSGELLKRVEEMPGLHFYVKAWSTDVNIASRMTGISPDTYPYSDTYGLTLPLAYSLLRERIGDRAGLQCMVTRENFDSFAGEILPFSVENGVSIFAESVIYSGNASRMKRPETGILSDAQLDQVSHTFASGGKYCERRQFGEVMLVGDKLSPGIAIPPRDEDIVALDGKASVRSLVDVFFNRYFREMRRKSEAINRCLCREFWNERRS